MTTATGDSKFFGSSYRSPYPYYKRDYDVHKRIWDPYVNRPSKAQRIFEILCFLIVLAAVPVFLGGVFQIFVCFYCFFLGILGLFSWTRRHSILWIICCLLLIATLIVSIILRASQTAKCMPFVRHSDNFGTLATNTPGLANNFRWDSAWCGNGTLTYITNGILLGLLLFALPFAIKIATERRRRFYDYDYVGGAPGVAPVAPGGMPTTGHTAIYTPGATVAPRASAPAMAVPAVIGVPATTTSPAPMAH